MITTSIEDRQQVVDTCTRLGWYADRRDWQALTDVFDDRVRMDYTSLNGGEPATLPREQIVQGWSAVLGRLQATQHLIANHLVELSGDTAVCTAAFQATHLLPNAHGGPTWTLGGTYRFDMVRRGDAWRIAGVTMTATWATGNQHVMALAAGG